LSTIVTLLGIDPTNETSAIFRTGTVNLNLKRYKF
jgi:hypothetical protein